MYINNFQHWIIITTCTRIISYMIIPFTLNHIPYTYLLHNSQSDKDSNFYIMQSSKPHKIRQNLLKIKYLAYIVYSLFLFHNNNIKLYNDIYKMCLFISYIFNLKTTTKVLYYNYVMSENSYYNKIQKNLIQRSKTQTQITHQQVCFPLVQSY